MRLSLLTSSLLLFSACGFGAQSSQLADARKAWGTGHTHYAYDFQWGCFCPQELVQPVRIEVQSGVIVTVFATSTGADVPRSKWGDWHTVEGLFDLIEADIEKPVADLKVTFDQASGLPTSYAVDNIANAVDDEVSFTAGGLADLP